MRVIGGLIFDNPRIDPTRPALYWDDQVMTHGEFAQRTAAVAAALKSDVSRGDRVSLLVGNEPEYLICYFAILSIGAVYVPLNWRLAPAEHANLMSNAGVKVLIAAAEHNETIALAREMSTISRVVVVGEAMQGTVPYSEWAANAAPPPPLDSASLDDIAAIVYTSGTTSLPKGACLTHRNIVVDMEHVALYAKPARTDLELHISPLYHQTMVHALVHIAYGAAVRLLRRFNAETVLETISDCGVTYMFVAPTMLYELLDSPNLKNYKLSSLKTIVYGAAPVTGARLKEAIAAFGQVLVHGYGLTEATSHCSSLGREEHTIAEGSIGRGTPDVELRIIDEQGRDCAPDQVGEIVIRGPTVMKGYWQDTEKTAETIIDGWLHSGDLARRDSRGYMYIMDRKKDLVISGGANIYPSDIEHALAKHPDVAEVAAFGLPDTYWGEALTVAVVARPGHRIDKAELLDFARRHLGGYQVPKRVEVLPALPRNLSGKILKRELRDRYGSVAT